MRHKERKKIVSFIIALNELKDCTDNEMLKYELIKKIMLLYDCVVNKSTAEQRNSYEQALKTMWTRDLVHVLIDWQYNHDMSKILEVL
jgi:hypothetical protein